MSADEIQVIQAWLRSQWHIQVPCAWLDACVNWIKEEANGESIPHLLLNQRVLEQWLMTDLRDLAHPVLPENISKAQTSKLSSCCCVQMDSLLDVSQPAYSQLQNKRGKDDSNDQVSEVTQRTQRPWEAKPTRMLMLQLTDGVQSLEGMEYRPIPALNTNLAPGTKLLLVGPIVARLGVLLLKAENVKVLGGEVEQLMGVNSQARVLCRILGLPEESSPQVEELDDQELLASVENTVTDSGYYSVTSDVSLRVPPNQPQHLISGPALSRDRDWDMDEIPDDDFRSIPDNFDDPPQNHERADDIPEDFDDIPLEELDRVMTPTDSEVPPSLQERSGANHSDTKVLNQSKPQEPSHSTAPARRTHQSLSPIDVSQTSLLSCPTDAPDPAAPIYLSSLQSGNWPPKSVQMLRLQAFIVTLVGNLRSLGGTWKLGATVSDGSGYLDVDLSNGLLTDLIGFSATEALVLRKDPVRRGEVDAGIKHCQRELVDMCCMMSVRVDPSGRGVVLSASPLSDGDCLEMEKRVKERRT
ncbi:hypothetical protein DNTS_022982 [Danionella cerebrum]|uniref:RecQ-mediated genome instability protein 1 n=1 Tax=Danionella cerebrum TaxID=2873325 RepID=A0A553RB84_9TELE|nr:hypothetical protein DNTS_022982 [Danionella translucida]